MIAAEQSWPKLGADNIHFHYNLALKVHFWLPKLQTIWDFTLLV